MIEFTDILYGHIRFPDWITPFFGIPEFARLRGVRLSNVDSFQFKDFAGPSRWEHGIAVAWLALRCAEARQLPERQRMELALAALLHDVATPPFAHTAEYVLEAFDHELESQHLLTGAIGGISDSGTAVFASQVPQFLTSCRTLSRKSGIRIDPDRVAEMIVGDGDLGFLVHGSVDLDNADNVTRACCYLGIDVDRTVPIALADWLGTQAGPPSNLDSVGHRQLTEWLKYRSELYTRFYESTDAELGRQAFLQNLMRRGLRAGLSRSSLIWNTDERLLFQLEQLGETPCEGVVPLRELVQRYRLLEAPNKIGHVELFDDGTLQAIGLPQSVAWIEEKVSTPYFQPFAIVIRARHGRTVAKSLLPPGQGALLLFKLGGPTREAHLPDWLRGQSQVNASDRIVSCAELSRRLSSFVGSWSKHRPWNAWSVPRVRNIAGNLANFGDWSFRLSRNESLHAYPGTFVNAIPSALISSLGLQGDAVLDPFGGSGQTAVAALNYGCSAVTSDSNYFASLIAKVRFTFLSVAARERIQGIDRADIQECEPAELPEFELRQKWFHPKTLIELGKLRAFIAKRKDPSIKRFCFATMSAVLTACTGRRGKEHGYFADNTPLEKGVKSPPYSDAIGEFLERRNWNLQQLCRLYGEIERSGRDPESALARISVVRADVKVASPAELGIEPNSLGAIITSPPYLCMADYTLGQRLSYELLCPDEMEADFKAEIGKRRSRFRGEEAVEEYRAAMVNFARLASQCIRKDGFVATVLGTPTAKQFASWNAMNEFDEVLSQYAFEKVWEVVRPINWHRNHGYSRLSTERVSVHRFHAK